MQFRTFLQFLLDLAWREPLVSDNDPSRRSSCHFFFIPVPPYNSLCNSSKSRQIMISFQTFQHNSNRAGGLEIPSERHALCILQAFGYAYADVPTGYEGPCVQTHPPAAANLPSLTGSSAARRSPQFLRSACPHLGAASALTQGHSPLESFTRLTGSVLLCCVCAFP